MDERLKNQGRLAEKEIEAQRLKLRIEGLVDSIRDALDPFEAKESPEDLKCDRAAELAIELARVHIEYLECIEIIRALKKALGR